ncbi:MAG: 30S ribosomal protein S6 [SAR324 cluster bacterium]|nr:30S ribosomal protein S6 [SAR324 cluster bacterium]
MQGYESIFILDPEIPEDEQNSLVDRLKGLIGSNGGNVLHHFVWGRRRMAYEVKKRQYGVYHLMYLDKSPEALRALENSFRIDEKVIKWLNISVEDVDKEFAAFEKLRTEGSVATTLGD